MTAAIFPPSLFASSPFPKRSEEHSFLDSLQWSLPHVSSSPPLGPCLSVKICNWIKQVYVSMFCFLCNLCPLPHTIKKKKKTHKTKCLPVHREKSIILPSKMKSYVFIWWEVFKGTRRSPLKYSGHLHNPLESGLMFY